MPIRDVLLYPDPRLKQISETVAATDDPAVSSLIRDLLDTLYDAPGCVGIAAPQIGDMKRIIIIDASRNAKNPPNHGRMVLINPVLEEQSGELLAREGCLSIPDLTANVRRAEHVKVFALNEIGEELRFETGGFEARVILHEYDHLDGILFLDRVASLKTDVFRRKRYAQPESSKEQV